MRRFVVCFMAGTLTASAALGQSLTGPVTQSAAAPHGLATSPPRAVGGNP